MKEVTDVKMYFYVDESGDPTILGKGGKNLLALGKVSKTFMLGHVEVANPKALSQRLHDLQVELAEDDYLRDIPSLHSTLRAFHASKHCAEVRERVYKALRDAPFQAFIVVARKEEHRFRKNFDLKVSRLYEYLVEKLFENRLHLFKEIDLYFSSRGSTVRVANMREALSRAMLTFQKKWGHENQNLVRVMVQQNSDLPMLQVADYVLWSVQRAFELGEFRYYNFIKERISLIWDIYDTTNYPKNYYSPKNPLSPEKMSPTGG